MSIKLFIIRSVIHTIRRNVLVPFKDTQVSESQLVCKSPLYSKDNCKEIFIGMANQIVET